MAVKEAKYICRTIFSKNKRKMLKERRTKSTVKKICVRKFCKDQYDKESFLSKKKTTLVVSVSAMLVYTRQKKYRSSFYS